MEFSPALEPGDEVEVTPVYSGSYAIGSGYYISSLGAITNLAAYEGKSTGVSDLIPVAGFSKVKVSNLISNQYSGVLAFFSSEQQIYGSNVSVYSGDDPGSIEVSIPEGALFIRVGANADASGEATIGAAVYKLVV